MFSILNCFIFAYTFIMNKENLPLINPLIRIAEYAASLTKNEWDDAAIGALAMFIRHETKDFTLKQCEKISETISEKRKGPLKDIKVKISPNGKVRVGTSSRGVEYDAYSGLLEYKKGFKL